MKEWNDRTKLAAAMAFALAGLLVAMLAVFQPHWIFGERSEVSLIPLPKPYADLSIFSNEFIDTYPSEESLESILNDFSMHIQQQGKNLELSNEQIVDLGAIAGERLRGFLDPDIKRDATIAARRGLKTPIAKLVAQHAKFKIQIESLYMAPFGLRSAIVVPRGSLGESKLSYQSFDMVRNLSKNKFSLPLVPDYDRKGVTSSSPRVEVLFPLLTPVIDERSGQLTNSPRALVVFCIIFVWAETIGRSLWLPEDYFQFSSSPTRFSAEDGAEYLVPCYAMAF